MILYHGTLIDYLESFDKDGILLSKSRVKLDFGKGFYTTASKDFAVRTARNRSRFHNGKYLPAVVILSYDDYVSLDDCEFRCFSEANLDWSKFVHVNREGKESHEYDIIRGPIADGKFNVESQRTTKLLSDKEYLARIMPQSVQYKCDQYSFHTEKALQYVRIQGYAEVNPSKDDEKYN